MTGRYIARSWAWDHTTARVREIAEELIAIRDWLPNGHRVSDYGHDLMIALGNPDLPEPTVCACGHDRDRHGMEAGCIECRCASSSGVIYGPVRP